MSLLGRLFRPIRRSERAPTREDLALADTAKLKPYGREEDVSEADTLKMAPLRAEGTGPMVRDLTSEEAEWERKSETEVQGLPPASDVVRRD